MKFPFDDDFQRFFDQQRLFESIDFDRAVRTMSEAADRFRNIPNAVELLARAQIPQATLERLPPDFSATFPAIAAAKTFANRIPDFAHAVRESQQVFEQRLKILSFLGGPESLIERLEEANASLRDDPAATDTPEKVDAAVAEVRRYVEGLPRVPVARDVLLNLINILMMLLSFFIDAELQDGLRVLKTRDGVAEAESIRRAIAAYLLDRGVSKRTAKAAKRKSR